MRFKRLKGLFTLYDKNWESSIQEAQKITDEFHISDAKAIGKIATAFAAGKIGTGNIIPVLSAEVGFKDEKNIF